MKYLRAMLSVAMLLSIWNSRRHADAQVQMIADFTQDIQTDFGIYHPYRVTFVPQAPPCHVEPDFGSVVNFSRVNQYWAGQRFNSADSTRLLQNHFTVRKSIYKQLYDVYIDCTYEDIPIFVTTDAVLHIYHVLYDQLLTEIEVRKFVNELELLTEALMEHTTLALAQSAKPEAKEALRRNLAFLSVACKLLKGVGAAIPETVAAVVDSELVLISNHDGFHYSPIFGRFSQQDYSQFQPRGHYTKNETLKAYFRAMMWYGRMIFTMEPDLFGDLARRHTLQALILVHMLYTLEVGL